MEKLFQLILISFFICNVQPVDAQILKKLQKKIVKIVEKEIDETIDGKKEKESEKKAETPKQKSLQEIEKGLEKQQFEKGLIIPAPNPRLQSLKLQSYKGLPRVGVLNYYDIYKPIYNKNGVGATTIATRDYDKKKLVETELKERKNNLKNYSLLLEMKFLNEFYNEIEKDYLMQGQIAQEHLKNIAYGLTTHEAYPKYFCGDDANCKKWINSNNERKSSIWGGDSRNEFNKQKSYITFVKDNLEDLKKWSAAINTEVYVVKKIKFQTYDFEKEGFPIERFHLGNAFNWSTQIPSNDLELRRHVPVNDIEMSIKNDTYIEFLIKIPADKAETFLKQNKSKTLLAVYKIKYDNIVDPAQSPFSKSFHLTSSIIEIYNDDALTNKVYEINISKDLINN
jgi:hypothetical protein